MVKIKSVLNSEGAIRSYEIHVDGRTLVKPNGATQDFDTYEQACKAVQQVEEMTQTRVRHETLAQAKGAMQFQFMVMQDGVDFGCHADFGNGMEPFYPDTPTSRFYKKG
ncbi:hypothetical protein [Alcaligenes faecalis]|uniref:Uncharacterized protein n=1 Tax=Alcaligenes faecalis TaxID=511 RepID=A0A2U2BNM8_ALCFA|nr:hypothetical protein [Alcaligenes faecalis]PWE15620.1 hypothetical protein DF183_02495 [Alcaligenes faecalis]